jgi:hypothetical protein
MSKYVVEKMKQAKRALKSFMVDMPDEDSYATVYCVAFDAAKALTEAIKEIPPALREAQKDSRKNPKQGKNHAKSFLRPRKAKKNEGE